MQGAYIQIRQARKVYETRHDFVEAVGGVSFDVDTDIAVADVPLRATRFRSASVISLQVSKLKFLTVTQQPVVGIVDRT